MPKYINVEGRRWRWSDLLKLRREQAKASRQAQPLLFEVKEDSRPPSQTTADGRYSEPTLFKL